METRLTLTPFPVSPVCVLVLLLVPGLLFARQASSGKPLGGQALLIGIEDYDTAEKLVGIENDVESLREALHHRGGYEVETVLNSAAQNRAAGDGDSGDRDSGDRGRSERECLQQRIASWLTQRGKTEPVILYFSGHGFRDEENHLYLAVKDCAPRDPKPGGIPIAWLREQLIACPARSKLLVLDACHAGNARSPAGKNAIVARELQDFFEKTEGLVTLASCTGDQQSYLWPEKKQSIFTYWLAQGLRGHADREPLGEITLNELDDYVTSKVRRTAADLYSLEQTPTRLQGPNVTQDVIMQLQPVDLKTLLDDMAEQMDVLIRLGKIEQVGIVPEFAGDVMGHLLGRQYGALATQCPVELANRLAVKSNGDYRVLTTQAVRELLQSRGIARQDIGTEKCRGLTTEGGALCSLISGQIDGLKGAAMVLRCRLLDVASGDERGTAGGSARLCASELAMQGISGRAEPLPSVAGAPPLSGLRPRADGRESARLDGSKDHPLLDAAFPYRVRILVQDDDGEFRERSGTIRGNDCFVRLSPGEVFRIRYGSDQRVFAKVLVDGLNTLPEKTQTRGIRVEPRMRDEFEQAQPVNLAEARAWGPLEPGNEYTVAGFYLKVGADAEYDEFTVVDATQTLAAGAGFTDQLGLITVAFYEPHEKQAPPPGGGRSFGAGRGNRYRSHTEVYRGSDEPGRLLAVVHIRYGE